MHRSTARRSLSTLPRPPPIGNPLTVSTRRSCGISELAIKRETRLNFGPRLRLNRGGRLVPSLRSGRSMASGSIPLLSTFTPFDLVQRTPEAS